VQITDEISGECYEVRGNQGGGFGGRTLRRTNGSS